MSKDTRIPRVKCLKCGYPMDATTSVFEDATPKAGDYSLCLGCGYVAVFNADHTLRAPTEQESEAIASNQQVIDAQMARSYTVGDKIKKRIKRRSKNG